MYNSQPIVTILIPHYKTLSLAKLCLHYLKKHTDLSRVKVIVIDNDSSDESVEFLRTVKWITLIERKHDEPETPPNMHSRAMDLGLSKVDTPYVLSIHTDTIMINGNWLDFILGQIKASDNIAGIGSWKLEHISPFKRFTKVVEIFLQTNILLRFSPKRKHNIAGVGDNYYYLRSHCALYRTDLIRKYNSGFSDGNEVAGKALHKKLTDAGYQMLFIPSEVLGRYIKHLNHATMIQNPELSNGQGKTASPKARKRIIKELEALNYKKILEDGFDEKRC
jgi:hypothetical protein